jgi:Holliday junction resolvase
VTNPQKAKGSSWERFVAKYFQARGYVSATRRYGAGTHADLGDLYFPGPVVIECKDHATLRLPAWMDETAVERENAHAELGILAIKRKGKPVEEGYAVTSIKEMVSLLQKAGY